MKNKRFSIPEELIRKIYDLYYEGLQYPLNDEQRQAVRALPAGQCCFLGEYWFSSN